jgi:hypothetical protein
MEDSVTCSSLLFATGESLEKSNSFYLRALKLLSSFKAKDR